MESEIQLSTTITIGGIHSYLSPSTISLIANNSTTTTLLIDSSALDKLSSSSSRSPKTLTLTLTLTERPKRFLPIDQSRAILLTLLNKLIRSGTNIRPNFLQLIVDTLNRGFDKDSIDFGSVLGFLDSLYGLNGTTVGETGVTDGELGVLESCIVGLEGICAILVHSLGALSRVVDGIAALSCEASRADVSGAFKFLDSTGDGGLCNKDEAGVASDLKVLLVGSKLVVGQDVSAKSKANVNLNVGVVSEIPQVHGGLRDAIRWVHVEMRSVLNSNARSGKALVRKVLSLALVLLELGESSWSRTKLTCESITDDALRSSVSEMFESNCPNAASLDDVYRSAVTAVKVDNTTFFQQVYNLLANVREVVAWEGAVALVLLDRNESSEKTKGAPSTVEVNGKNVNPDKKSEKKKKAVLGKGTALIRELLKDRLKSHDSLKEWARDLSLFFNPKEAELDTFLMKLKDIVETNESRRLPKLPKGTRDFAKEQMIIREKAFSIIQKVFKKHGATALDTPAFEMRETLMGKYGEDSKLIYDLADQGGELCSLRYDLTVPFARYVAMNGLTSFKRYQIAKVYRRDNPSKGRYREFYQCDFDIAGQFEVMGPDFEVVKVLTELLDELEIGDYEIKLNHRKLLDGMLEICGVSADKFRTICSSIDKLDKQSFEQIKKEMVEEKGLSVEVAERIGTFVNKRGHPLELLSELKQEGSQFLENKGSVSALNDLEILFKALEKSKCVHRVVFDLSLARGLDYYTGVIFEAVFKGSTQVGSIAAGGRYDNLIGTFGTKQVSAVGVSLGIERVFTIMELLVKDQNQAIRATETQVLVGILGDDLSQAAELVSLLWKADLKAEYMVNKKPLKLFARADESKIPWMVVLGDKEQNEGVVQLRNVVTREQEEVTRGRIVEELKKRLNSTS